MSLISEEYCVGAELLIAWMIINLLPNVIQPTFFVYVALWYKN
jgi:hypothetical protein